MPHKDYRLVMRPSGRVYTARREATILEAIGPEGIIADCGGRGLCGKCLVRVTPPGNLSPPTPEEIRSLGEERLGKDLRLACQARIRGDVTLETPNEIPASGVVSGKTDLTGRYPVNPQVERLVLPAADPLDKAGERPDDLLTYVTDRWSGLCGKKLTIREPAVIARLSRPGTLEGEVTLVNHRKRGVTALLTGRKPSSLGFAVDLGTTTVAVYLVDLPQGEIVASRAAANPQGRFGADVISRITCINEREDRLPILQGLIIAEVNGLMAGCLQAAGAAREDVDEVVVVGNTAMQQIFAGLHPYGLGLHPYLPVTRAPREMRAAELGLELCDAANVYIFPVIAGFIGGDTVGAILSQGLFTRKEVTLLIDIGTNGELVMGNRDGLWATSCATGPALEGAHISAGMPAMEGAIDQVRIDPDNYRVFCRTIGGAAPKGICGSGIVDALAEMYRVGILLPNGRIREGLPGVSSDRSGIGRSFALTDAGGGIGITLSDVRQVQLAKAALAAGIRLLQEKTANQAPELIILTGAFGARFNWRSAVAIGMLPRPSSRTKIIAVENAAGLGAIVALLDRKKRTKAQNLAGKVRFLELANEPGFALAFTEALNFPAPAILLP
ncbi:MAG: ASKHA domain-containing protein [Smithellaceae bacterium]|nr:ASKHA domain-containing protein [Smithellaceae bacterium]